MKKLALFLFLSAALGLGAHAYANLDDCPIGQSLDKNGNCALDNETIKKAGGSQNTLSANTSAVGSYSLSDSGTAGTTRVATSTS